MDKGTQNQVNLQSIDVKGEINDPNRDGQHKDFYKTGKAKGLLRFEIAITIAELMKVRAAFSDDYRVFPVIITLVIGGQEYCGKLRFPKSRRKELYSVKSQKGGWLQPWVCAPLKDKNGGDVKLAYALKCGGFLKEEPVTLRVLRKKILVLNDC